MRVHYLQHVPFEGLGSMEAVLTEAGCSISCTRLHNGDKLPDVDEFDFLIVLGGPMSVNDEERFSWLAPEKELVRAAIATDKRVLGICLGAQLIASALDQSVYPNTHTEIGWYPVTAALRSSMPASETCYRFPEEMEAFHWHGETFDLPEGAVLLASTEGCCNQAFQLGRHVIGLQFHLETTPESAAKLVAHCRDEMTPSRYVQDASAIADVPPEKYAAINTEMAKLLRYLLDMPAVAASR